MDRWILCTEVSNYERFILIHEEKKEVSLYKVYLNTLGFDVWVEVSQQKQPGERRGAVTFVTCTVVPQPDIGVVGLEALTPGYFNPAMVICSFRSLQHLAPAKRVVCPLCRVHQ